MQDVLHFIYFSMTVQVKESPDLQGFIEFCLETITKNV